MIWLLFFVALLLFLFLYARSAPAKPCILWPSRESGPLVIAHGNDCGNGLYPGNSAVYLQKMVELKVDAIEVDLWLTADGHLVLIHDIALEMFSDGSGLVEDMTLKQLQRWNIAYHWSRDGKYYPYRDKPLRVVTLDEALVMVGDMPMILEIKSRQYRAAQVLAEVLSRNEKQEQVIVSSFHQGVINEFRRLSPRVATGTPTWDAIWFFIAHLFRAEQFLCPSYRAMQLPMEQRGIQVVTESLVQAAKRKNLHLSVWTVNSREHFKRYIDMGVHGIITDRPDLLMTLLAKPQQIGLRKAA
ncbi:glycerophosphodiester phosphodiesterase [Microbulbifer sp. OS29]|uniref:Glycerophosphodiester phosphodiesterase n=1 Tax=Microbulbifer okhotskensis TaxID=2926617 RepID=A0A9X2EU55_9GAMM|nr:glycerophosphodiester phosphodiesterase [Microbulbifer okhotskensis]MCO1335613.1 glycerophosphodiester phosphodiesterase [Microbulbifer okhotskensis]